MEYFGQDGSYNNKVVKLKATTIILTKLLFVSFFFNILKHENSSYKCKHYYKTMVFMLVTSCLKWLNVSIMTNIKSNNIHYD
jgi:hypothetical protein